MPLTGSTLVFLLIIERTVTIIPMATIRPEFRRQTRIGDYPAPELPAGMSNYYRQRQPWRFILTHYWENGLVFVSGDGFYEAVMHMHKGKLEARVTRLYVDREGEHVFWATGDDVPSLEPNLVKTRLTLLFEQLPRERLAEIGHLHWGTHNDFCSDACIYATPQKAPHPDLDSLPPEWAKAQRRLL